MILNLKTLSIIFISSLLFAYTAKSQSFKREIEWSANKVIENKNSNYLHFDFKNAMYDNIDILLPKYFERIKIDNLTDKVELDLKNLSYQILSDNELSNVKDLPTDSDINLKYNIQTDRGEKFVEFSFSPIIKDGITYKRIIKFEFIIQQYDLTNNEESIFDYATNSVLKSGRWVKIQVQKNGLYRMTKSELNALGFSDFSKVSVFGHGGKMLNKVLNSNRIDDLIQNPVYYGGDYILFYAEGPIAWSYDNTNNMFKHRLHSFSNFSNYFLTDNVDVKEIVQEQASNLVSNKNVTSFDSYHFHENDSVNLIKSGRNWYGEHFDIITSRNFIFNFSNVIASSEVKLATNLLARSSTASNFKLSANGSLISTININKALFLSYSPYALEKKSYLNFNTSSNSINIGLSYTKSNSSSEGWLDYIDINVRENLSFHASQFGFRDINSVDEGNISEFAISNSSSGVKVWDVTNITEPFIVSTSFSGSTTKFTTETESLKNFVAYNGTSFYSPIIIGEVPNQDLHGVDYADMLIVSNPLFLSYANQIANLHRNNDDMKVLVVTPQQIYNEFSSGSPDIAAIRNFAKKLYDNPNINQKLKYLLLFGDGSYDNNTMESSNSNYILTYQSSNSLSPTGSYVSDDFFGLLDEGEGSVAGSESMDIGVGRFPVQTSEEAKTVVDKIINYTSSSASFGDWRNVMCFIGDDAEDSPIHQEQANQLSEIVDTLMPGFNLDKIFLDAYPQISTPAGDRYPDANRAVNDRINRGALIVNYTGHGNEVGLTHEHVVQIDDIMSWGNYNALPLFMTATCEFSRYDDRSRTSAGELILLNPKGGGIALFTTTRLVYSSPNFTLNKCFYDNVFEFDAEGKRLKLGEIMRRTKNAAGNSLNKRNFSLLGDPALTLSIPNYYVSTESINGIDINNNLDTLKALSKVTIKGFVHDKDNNKLDDFNGYVYPVVYDKAMSLISLSNDGKAPLHFNLQNSILFKGKSSVVNGEFEFSFIVPKDISYRIDKGKISYYANSSNIDASGYFKEVVIGGSSDIKHCL